jgi:hypothetical protein
MMYLTYIVAGCVVLEFAYGGVMDYAWETNNKGKLFHQVDWTKFKNADDDEDEEDEE